MIGEQIDSFQAADDHHPDDLHPDHGLGCDGLQRVRTGPHPEFDPPERFKVLGLKLPQSADRTHDGVCRA